MITAEEGSALVGDDGAVHLPRGLAIHPRWLRQLACDATIRLLIHGRSDDEAGPLDLGRSKRLITDKQRAALLTVFDHCDFEHCTVPARFCQWHHVEHWMSGGSTDLGNLRPMCGRHHRLAHGEGVRVVIGPRNRLVALRGDKTGEGAGASSPAGQAGTTPGIRGQVRDGSELVACNLAVGVEVGDGSGLFAHWGGQHIDTFASSVIVKSLLRLFDESEGGSGSGGGGSGGSGSGGGGSGGGGSGGGGSWAAGGGGGGSGGGGADGACSSHSGGVEPNRAQPAACCHDRPATNAPSPPFRERE